jgi:hypothetical protein
LTDVPFDQGDIDARNQRKVPVGEDPAWPVAVIATPVLRPLDHLVALDHPFVRGRTHG